MRSALLEKQIIWEIWGKDKSVFIQGILEDLMEVAAEMSKSADRGWHLIGGKFVGKESKITLKFLTNITGRW